MIFKLISLNFVRFVHQRIKFQSSLMAIGISDMIVVKYSATSAISELQIYEEITIKRLNNSGLFFFLLKQIIFCLFSKAVK